MSWRCFSSLWFLFTTLLVLSLPPEVGAQSPTEEQGEGKIINLKKVASPPRLDAVFDDECWQEVKWWSNFLQSDPVRRAPPSEKTEFAVVQCGRDLYFAFKCYDSTPSEISALQKRRDGEMRMDDRVEIMLDTYLDRRWTRYYSFVFNPLGTKRDSKWGNLDWDGEWDVATRITNEGWFAEVRISLVPLAFPRKGKGYFGINIERRIRRLREENLWSYSKEPPGRVDDFGLLGEIDFASIPFSSRLQTLLYGVGEAGSSFKGHMGLDAHKFLTPDIKAAFTLYPDYSDVEAVYQTIDISYTERSLPDTRPFFTEGREFFGDFYSRRIDLFDFGLKVFGREEKVELGLLDCLRFSPSRNDIVLNLNYSPNNTSSLSLGINSRDEGSHRNLVTGIGGGREINSGSWLHLLYASSQTRNPDTDGSFFVGSLWHRLGERGGLSLDYINISPGFNADLQLVGEVGVRIRSIGLNYGDAAPRGKKWWERYRVWSNYRRGHYWDGRLKIEDKSVGGFILLKGDKSISFNRSVTFYDPYRDNFTSIGCGFGSGEKFNLGINYGEGVRTNLDYKFASAGLSRRLLDNRLFLSLNWEKRWVKTNGEWSIAQQIWGSISYDIGRDYWIVVRLYNYKESGSHTNFSAILTKKDESKKALYLVLGDPFALDTTRRVTLKYVVPW